MDFTKRIAASWYDGTSAVRHKGSLDWSRRDPVVLDDGYAPVEILLADLVHRDSQRDSQIYGLESNPGFRLILPHELPQELDNLLPSASTYGGWVDRLGLGKAAIGFAVASAVALAVALTAPEWLGPMVPESWERRMGEAMVGDFGNRVCHTPEGDAALAKMVAQLDDSDTPVKVGVANIGMVNAVALPGAQILLFDGLLQQADSPEEVAGVLGHEIGHVRERHVMTAMLRQFGLSILVSGLNSGVAEGVFGVAAMGYSREAEREADEYSRSVMRQADISPLGSAGFFDRMAKEYGDEAEDRPAVVGWLASHPASGERAKAYRADYRDDHDYDPVLTEREFEALKSMCEQDDDVEDFDWF